MTYNELKKLAKEAGYTERECREMKKDGMLKLLDDEGYIEPKENPKPRHLPTMNAEVNLCPRCNKSNYKLLLQLRTVNQSITIKGVVFDGLKINKYKCECGQVFVLRIPIHKKQCRK